MHKFDEMTEPELKELFMSLAKHIEAKLPPNTGFIVLCAAVDGCTTGVTQYASNITRESAQDFMVDLLARWVRHEEIPR